MHVLERKNKESFDLVEFVASMSQVDFVARFPSNRFWKSSHISRIVLRGNVTREFEHNYDDDQRDEKIKKKTTGFLSEAKTLNVQRNFWQIPSASPHSSHLGNPDSEIQDIFAWNPKSWVLESGKQLKESGMPLMMGIRNLSFNDKSQESWTWNSESTAWNPESESVLILGFPYMGRIAQLLLSN